VLVRDLELLDQPRRDQANEDVFWLFRVRRQGRASPLVQEVPAGHVGELLLGESELGQ